VICKHCGTPFTPAPERPEFCCAGCQFVFDLIAAQGLGKFYDLRNAALPPVKSLVFQKRDYAWLEDLAANAEHQAAGGDASLLLDLQGISCLGCVWLIERLFQHRPGALDARVQSAIGRIDLHWRPGECDIAGFAHELQRFGYLLGPFDPGASAAAGRSRSALAPLVRRMGLCGAFAMNAMLFSVPLYFGMTPSMPEFVLFTRMAFLFATLSFFTGGTFFFARAWHSLRRGALHIDLPIALGLIAAYSGSICAWRAGVTDFLYFEFVSTFTFLMLVGRWAQQAAIEKNRNRLLGSQANPGEVRIVPGGETLPASALTAGVCYEVLPGGMAPVRSKLLSEAATLGLEWINGESEARIARIGQAIPSGAVNYSQETIRLEAAEAWTSSILCSLLKIAPKEERRGGLDTFLRAYLAVILIVATAGFAGWFFSTHDLLRSLQVLTSILVVSCPCAAGVAIPLADKLAISRLRNAGVFVREQSLWARVLKVRTILFDKTGTLTLETMALRNPDDPMGLPALGPAERAILLAMVRDNYHPVSSVLREILMTAGTDALPLENAPLETVGYGLEVAHDGHTWRLGRPGWIDSAHPKPSTHDLAGPKASVDCEFSCDGRVLARFQFTDQLRHDAADEVAGLQRDGLAVHILSGDRDEKVASMAAQLGIDPSQCHGGLSPTDKGAWIRSADPAREHTLMIGDGANDSMAFNESLCTGTPAIDRGLLEQKADFYFLGRGLNGVRQLLDAAHRRRRAVHSVLAFAILYNAVALILSLAGRMHPVLAALLMPASSLISILIVFAFSGTRPRDPVNRR